MYSCGVVIITAGVNKGECIKIGFDRQAMNPYEYILHIIWWVMLEKQTKAIMSSDKNKKFPQFFLEGDLSTSLFCWDLSFDLLWLDNY